MAVNINYVGTPTRFCQKAIATTNTTLYTSQLDGRSAILDMVITNTTASPITVTVYIGSAAAANAFNWSGTSIAANSSSKFSGFQVLNQNESMIAVASGAGLSCTISGLERV